MISFNRADHFWSQSFKLPCTRLLRKDNVWHGREKFLKFRLLYTDTLYWYNNAPFIHVKKWLKKKRNKESSEEQIVRKYVQEKHVFLSKINNFFFFLSQKLFLISCWHLPVGMSWGTKFTQRRHVWIFSS